MAFLSVIQWDFLQQAQHLPAFVQRADPASRCIYKQPWHTEASGGLTGTECIKVIQTN